MWNRPFAADIFHVVRRNDVGCFFRGTLIALRKADIKPRCPPMILKLLRRKRPKAPRLDADLREPAFESALRTCRAATMTSTERLYALHSAVRYVVEARIPGDFVECGVWRGGSVMMIALTLKSLGVTDRDIYLFDTFTGPPSPTEADVDFSGISAVDQEQQGIVWPKADVEEVRANLVVTGYAMDRFHIVPGDVLQTIPRAAPNRLALLRLDTDWYESTRHELDHLFPRLEPRGALIIDDYGHYRGARRAVDNYLARQPVKYFLHRIDYTARMLIKA